VVIDHDFRLRVVVHGVDSEVAPRRVFNLRAPNVVAKHATVGVDHVPGRRRVSPAAFLAHGLFVPDHLLGCSSVHHRAKGGHLNHFAQPAVLAASAKHHVDDAKAPTDDEGATEQTFHLFGCGVGGHIEIFGSQAEQQVAHCAANDVGLEAAVVQRLHDLHGAVVYQRHVDAVLGFAHLNPVAERAGATTGRGLRLRFRFGRFAHQLV